MGFNSLTEGIDTTTPAGRLTFHLFGALAEFERELIRERTAAGLAAARARGRSGGRPRLMTPEKLAVARQMYDSRGHTPGTIATTVGVSRSTLYRYLGDQGRPELSSLKGREGTRIKKVGSRPPLGKLSPGGRLPDRRDKARPGDTPVPRDKRERSYSHRGDDQSVRRTR
jgi:Resolvase, N terminal domain/Helix-turn-helix domain of resolvase